MYDQVRYYNYTGYLRSFGTFEEIDINFEQQLKDSIFFFIAYICSYANTFYKSYKSNQLFANKLYYISLFAF